MADQSPADLIEAKKQYRPFIHKLFTDNSTGVQVQLLRVVAMYETCDLYAEYCINTAPQMQYIMPIATFLGFHEQN